MIKKPFKVWVIGGGSIGLEYSRILDSLSVEHLILTKTSNKRNRLEGLLKNFVTLDFASAIRTLPKPDYVIIAVPILDLEVIAKIALQANIEYSLIEKPVSINRDVLTSLLRLDIAGSIKVAVNRRFYNTINHIRNNYHDVLWDHVICEVSERGHIVEKLNYPTSVISKWAICNSIHYWDVLRFLLGEISTLTIERSKPSYHPHTHYFGRLVAKRAKVIQFSSIWSAPGDWSIDLRSNDLRLKLNPFEHLTISKIIDGKVFNEEIIEDTEYKAGFFMMVSKFINLGEGVSLSDYSASFDLIQRIYYD